MNPLRFTEIIGDLPDDLIESAAEPHGSPVRLSYISALAACIVLAIAAAVYPRIHGKEPARIEPVQTTVSQTETTAVTALTQITAATTTQTQTEPTQPTASETTETQTEPTQTTASETTETQTEPTQTTASETTETRTEPTQTTAPKTTESQTEPTQTAENSTQSTASDTGAPVETTASEDETTAAPCWLETTAAPCWLTEPYLIWSQEPLLLGMHEVDTETETLYQEVQTTLYRDALPNGFPDDLSQRIDFSKNDCLVIRFQTPGCGEGLAEKIGGTGMLYGIEIIPPSAPIGTVQELEIALIIPKSLYSERSPDGINRWLRKETVPTDGLLHCSALLYTT